MLLKEYLSEDFTKDQLIDFARMYDIKNYSGLRKAELIEKIAKDFCNEKIIRNRVAALSEEQLELFRKAGKEGMIVPEYDVIYALWLEKCWLGSFDELTDKFYIFEDVAEVFSKIDNKDFKAEHSKKGWLVKCLGFVSQYYGVAPVEVIFKIFNQKVKCSIEEMTTLISEIPIDMSGVAYLTMYELGLTDWPKDHPLYSKYGLVVDLELIEYEEFDELLDYQMDKEFYIPSVKQVDDLYKYGYETGSLEYKRLKSFLRKKLGFHYDEADFWCAQIWENSYEGESPFEMIQDIAEVCDYFDEELLDEFAGILALAHNSTRVVENRGYTPSEQREIDLKSRPPMSKPPVIVPESTKMAELLEELSEDLAEMGIPLDLDGDADLYSSSMFLNGLDDDPVVVEKKVYPNDPCPCGSGKKYKNCCGKNKR